MTVLYHYKVVDYFYWIRVGIVKESSFGFSLGNYLISVALFLINMFFLLKLNGKKLVFMVLSIFFLLLTVPSLVSFSSGDIYPTKLLLYHQLLFFGIYLLSKLRISFDKVPTFNKRQGLYLLFMLITIGVIPYLLIYGPHINLKNLILQDVYYTRFRMAGLSNPYFGYTYSVFTKILIPLMIVFALELRNRLMLIIGILYLVLFYLFGAHKTVYVGLIVVLIFYRFSYTGAIKNIIRLFNALLVLSLGLAIVVNYDYLWILTFRRVHFLPALLDICYLDFFQEKPIYWSESVLGSFIEYPYNVPHANLIGEHYFNRPKMSANNGLVSDGYMNFGSWGVFIHIFMVAAYFMILNNLKIPAKYFGLFLLVIFSFISSSTFTVFLTHGAIALLFVSIFLLKEKKNPNVGSKEAETK
ncbi:MAG: hypothetical protein AB3N14_18920 [Flavobacteriaceae bacterium]